jgi:hypothetical protein
VGSPPGGSIEERLQWLVDRAMVNDLLVEHARCLDQRDWTTLQSLFTEDGYLQLPYDRVPARMMARLSEEHLSGYLGGTLHMSANYAIEIDGDHATARSYFLAAHVNSDDLYDHGDVAGWYDSTFRRVGDGWRFASIDETFRWKSGSGLPDETYVPKAPRD